MVHFLLKTEPKAFSIDDLKRDGTTTWGGVRNYQARNIIREMKVGDTCFIYHSSCEVPAVVGVGEVVREAFPDPLQFDRTSEYFDPGSKVVSPRWDAVEVRYVRHLDRPVTLTELRHESALANMRLLQKGNRLSVSRVTDDEAQTILSLERSTP